MKRYALKTKDGEVINTINAENPEIAADLFAKIKSLKTQDLLKIYDVGVFNGVK